MITTFNIDKFSKFRMNARYLLDLRGVDRSMVVLSFMTILLIAFVIITILLLNTLVMPIVVKVSLAAVGVVLIIHTCLRWSAIRRNPVNRRDESLWSDGEYLFYQYQVVEQLDKSVSQPELVIIELSKVEFTYDKTFCELRFANGPVKLKRGVSVDNLKHQDYLQYVLETSDIVESFVMHSCWNPDLVKFLESKN